MGHALFLWEPWLAHFGAVYGPCLTFILVAKPRTPTYLMVGYFVHPMACKALKDETVLSCLEGWDWD